MVFDLVKSLLVLHLVVAISAQRYQDVASLEFGKIYRYSAVRRPFQASRSFCAVYGGKLVRIESAEEVEFLRTYIRPQHPVWLNVKPLSASEGHFVFDGKQLVNHSCVTLTSLR